MEEVKKPHGRGLPAPALVLATLVLGGCLSEPTRPARLAGEGGAATGVDGSSLPGHGGSGAQSAAGGATGVSDDASVEGQDSAPSAAIDAAPAVGACPGGSIPGDVAAILRQRCLSCHGDPPLMGVPTPLTGRDDFLRIAATNPAKTVGQMVLAQIDPAAPLRMPPPPAATLTISERQSLQRWVDAGLPLVCSAQGGQNDGGPATAIDAGAVDAGTFKAVCTSGKQARGNGSQMRPGDDCTRCHGFRVAGTVYPTAHEPNGCYGTSGVQVVITDSNNMTVTFTSNAAGNFYGDPIFAYPVHIKITQAGRERQMLTPVQRTDCNTCHTEAGANLAPGRIMAP